MQRTVGRSAFNVSMASTFHLQPRSLSPMGLLEAQLGNVLARKRVPSSEADEFIDLLGVRGNDRHRIVNRLTRRCSEPVLGLRFNPFGSY